MSVGSTKHSYFFLAMPNESTCFPSKCISALGAPSTKVHSCKESSFLCVSCRRVRNHHYPCTKALSTSSVRAQQRPSCAVQGVPVLPSLYQPNAAAPSRGSSLSLRICGRRMRCPRTPRGSGHGSAQKAGVHISAVQTGSASRPLPFKTV